MTPMTGRGWTKLEDDELHGMIIIHLGESRASWRREPKGTTAERGSDSGRRQKNMAPITVSDLDEATVAWLDKRALAHGWSLPEEIKRILAKVAQSWDELEQFLKDHPPPLPAPPPPTFDRKRLEEIRERHGLKRKDQ